MQYGEFTDWLELDGHIYGQQYVKIAQNNLVVKILEWGLLTDKYKRVRLIQMVRNTLRRAIEAATSLCPIPHLKTEPMKMLPMSFEQSAKFTEPWIQDGHVRYFPTGLQRKGNTPAEQVFVFANVELHLLLTTDMVRPNLIGESERMPAW